jgi:hypothetical protein
MLPAHRHGFGLSFVGAAQNLTLVLLPPFSIAVLDAAGPDGVALSTIGLVTIGIR